MKRLTADAVAEWENASMSAETRRARRRDFQDWLIWLDEHGIHWSNATTADATEWRNDMKDRQYANSTIRRKLSSCAGFYHHHKYPSPFTGVTGPPPDRDSVPTWLTSEELDLFLHAALASDKTSVTLCGLLLMHGLRRMEIVNANFKDIQWSDPALLHVRGKGMHRRTIPARYELLAAVTEHHDQNGGEEARWDSAMVRTPNRLRASLSTIYNYCRDIAERAGFPEDRKVSPHTIRRSVATKAMRAGVPLPDIQALLGHAHLETTSDYLRPSSVTENRALDAVFAPQSIQGASPDLSATPLHWARPHVEPPPRPSQSETTETQSATPPPPE